MSDTKVITIAERLSHHSAALKLVSRLLYAYTGSYDRVLLDDVAGFLNSQAREADRLCDALEAQGGAR